ncbi:hypothetical protein IV203_016797 [Nitzschia inconspicua]|uniref:Uncharacterized protein n=1 Tax=Nitzschia inconspicua TaxID=303405 RepID=A0A9K3KQL1_9STRA|nr:hypothetical protein IV203_016797 [Nitzschia inconspicua]
MQFSLSLEAIISLTSEWDTSSVLRHLSFTCRPPLTLRFSPTSTTSNNIFVQGSALCVLGTLYSRFSYCSLLS